MQNTLNVGTIGDTIVGEAGNDTLTGDTGSDTFVFATNFGNDTITDFVVGAVSDDVIELDNALGLTDLAGVLAATSQVGADAVIAVDVSNSITLSGVDMSAFHQDDFRFV